MQVRRGAFTAVVVAGSLALAACSGGGDSPPPTTSSTTSSSSSSTTSSTTTQSPTATKTVALPPEATKHTEAGAMAFARYYWEQASQSLVTLDVTTVRAMSTSECKDCRGLEDVVSTMSKANEHAEKASYVIKLVTYKSGNADSAVVEVAGREQPVKVLNKAGSAVRTSQPGVFTWSVDLVWEGGRWWVDAFTAV